MLRESERITKAAKDIEHRPLLDQVEFFKNELMKMQQDRDEMAKTINTKDDEIRKLKAQVKELYPYYQNRLSQSDIKKMTKRILRLGARRGKNDFVDSQIVV